MNDSDLKKIERLIQRSLESFATKDDLKNLATKNDVRGIVKDELRGYVTKDDLKNFATKDDFKGLATKEALSQLSQEMKEGFDNIKTELGNTEVAIIETIEGNYTRKEEFEKVKQRIKKHLAD